MKSFENPDQSSRSRFRRNSVGEATLCLVISMAFLWLPVRIAAQSYTFTTLAGQAEVSGSTDGPPSNARFDLPLGLAVDRAGNVYVADTFNDTIRKITPDGVVSTLAGRAGNSGSADGPRNVARFSHPSGVAVDSAGNVYVADEYNYTVRKIAPDGVVNTPAGQVGSIGSSNGIGAKARFGGPSGIAVDGLDNVYVADGSNNSVRKITPEGLVTTLAGGNPGSADGSGSSAEFYGPSGVAVDTANNVYVADKWNETIRKITPDGVVSTIAGKALSSGSADGIGTGARFSRPSGIAVDGAGNVYVSDGNNHTIRKITPNGIVSTLAGKAGTSGSTDGIQSIALFDSPSGVAVDSAGNVYVADSFNHTIRKIAADGLVSTLAGQAETSGRTDTAKSDARFNHPSGVAVDSAAAVYVADRDNHRIRKIAANGLVSTVAGQADSPGAEDGPGSNARFNLPSGVAVDGAGNVYVADTGNYTIRKITPEAVVSTVAGKPGSPGGTDGPGSVARFGWLSGITVDGAGKVYVVDANTIRKIAPDGFVSTLAGGSQGRVLHEDGFGSNARFFYPSGVALDSAGNVYVADTSNYTIRKITPSGLVSTLAGSVGKWGSADGSGSEAQFSHPAGIAVDGAGNVYVAEEFDETIRKITPNGFVTTVAGEVGSFGSEDGPGSDTRFHSPSAVAVDNAGNIYVADTFNHTIRKGIPSDGPQPPVIKVQPQGHSAAIGTATIFSVSATGTLPLSFEWFKDGLAISRATNFTYFIDSVLIDHAGSYSVRVFNAYGSTTSSSAVLSVITPPRPPNDNFANRIEISGTDQRVVSTNVGATKEAGEPNHAGNLGGKSVWWRWAAGSTGVLMLDTVGSDFNTRLAVYSGNSLSDLMPVATENDPNDNSYNRRNLVVAAGGTYHIAVDGYNGAVGNIVLNSMPIS